MIERTSLSLTFIKRLRRDGNFPRAVPLGDRRIGFLEHEVSDWVASRVAMRPAA
ncbi:AlpA family phage regulatory protein [Mesorhizobium australicum]|uniref:AlpA family phage regulatory protein n=1 Tax=Mesorhizobium australicum TaxID=536018 RepID=A0ACC6T6A5_9HYPH